MDAGPLMKPPTYRGSQFGWYCPVCGKVEGSCQHHYFRLWTYLLARIKVQTAKPRKKIHPMMNSQTGLIWIGSVRTDARRGTSSSPELSWDLFQRLYFVHSSGSSTSRPSSPWIPYGGYGSESNPILVCGHCLFTCYEGVDAVYKQVEGPASCKCSEGCTHGQ